MFEIEDQTNSQFRDSQIVQHQSTFVVGDFVDDFCVYNDRMERNEIRIEESYLSPL